jgi:hypothetical protein
MLASHHGRGADLRPREDLAAAELVDHCGPVHLAVVAYHAGLRIDSVSWHFVDVLRLGLQLHRWLVLVDDLTVRGLVRLEFDEDNLLLGCAVGREKGDLPLWGRLDEDVMGHGQAAELLLWVVRLDGLLDKLLLGLVWVVGRGGGLLLLHEDDPVLRLDVVVSGLLLHELHRAVTLALYREALMRLHDLQRITVLPVVQG